MALRQNLYNESIFKVLEINNVLALRTGHILSQVPLFRNKFITGAEGNFVQNGQIVFLDVDGTLAARHKLGFTTALGTDAIPQAVDTVGVLKPFIIYNEELMTGPLTDLKYFAEIFVGAGEAAVSFPRALALNIGDTFTTNNFAGARAAGFATIPANTGLITVAAGLPAGAYVGPLFRCKVLDEDGVNITLPDGVTPAIEFTVVDLNAVFVGS